MKLHLESILKESGLINKAQDISPEHKKFAELIVQACIETIWQELRAEMKNSD